MTAKIKAGDRRWCNKIQKFLKTTYGEDWTNNNEAVEYLCGMFPNDAETPKFVAFDYLFKTLPKKLSGDGIKIKASGWV